MKRFLTIFLVAFLVFGSVSPVFATFNITGGGTYRLTSSIGTTNTSINLSSFKEPISNTPYTMSYLQTDIAYGTLDPQNESRSEFISFTGITQNSNGTAVLTGVTRGLTRTPTPGVTGCTASTTLRQAHTGQSVFILSDNPCVFTQYAVKQNDETVTGSWIVPTPVLDGNPATKGYVDSIAFGGSVPINRIIVAGTAGQTISTGQIIYFDLIQDEWMLADASVAASSTQVLLGIAQGSGTNGVSISGGVLIKGLDEKNTGGTAGNLIYLSDTAGATTTTPGTFTKVLGSVRNSSSIYFAPTDYLSLSDVFVGGDLTVSATTTLATSTIIGAFPAYEIGKNQFVATSSGSGTFNIPQGVTKLWFEMVGGGGGAKGVPSGNAGDTGAGGGSAGYCSGTLDVRGLPSLAYTIGAAGTGGTTGGTNGNNGATSTLATNLCIAGQGYGGEQIAGGIGGVASTATSTVLAINGQRGGGGVDAGSVGVSGKGGDSMMGLGGASIAGGASNSNGLIGTGNGSGGGAGVASAAGGATGGNGTPGALIIRW